MLSYKLRKKLRKIFGIKSRKDFLEFLVVCAACLYLLIEYKYSWQYWVFSFALIALVNIVDAVIERWLTQRAPDLGQAVVNPSNDDVAPSG